MATETTYCSDCKKNTVVVLDHSSGDVICTECGLVVESSYIDETSEWRTFANESTTEDRDPNRVGSASNPLLSISTGGGGGGSGPLLSTVISKSNGKSSSSSRYNDENRRWQSKNNIIDLNDADNRRQRTLIQAFKTIENMADCLGLVTTIKNRACENYKRVVVDDTSSSTFVKGSRNQDAIMAACLYVACRQEEKPRTVKEICLVAGVSKKELGRAKDYIMKKLNDQALTLAPVVVVVVVQDQMGTHQYSAAAPAPATDQHKMGTIHAEDFMRRFCSHLGMSNGAMKAAQEAVKKVSEELDIRRSPLSVAAAVIYMITQLSSVDNSLEQHHEKKRQVLKDISAATGGVAEGTIKNAYKDIFPYATRLIPTWYAKEEDLKRKLCRP